MRLKFKYWFIFLYCLGSVNVTAQNKVLTFGKQFDISMDMNLPQATASPHESFQPQIREQPAPYRDSLRSWFNRKLFHEHFLILDSGGVILTVDPAFNFEVGTDMASKMVDEAQPAYYKNTRGAIIRGSILGKAGFVSSFYENQAVFPDYLDTYIATNEVVPGQGRVKELEEGFDYAMASGSFFYTPGKHLQLIAGHGKHFIGDGYRSLFLSDNAFNYPYFRSNLLFWEERISYTFLLTSFQSLYRLPVSADTEPPFMRKTGNFHYLSWKAGDRFRLGFFEAGVYQSVDSAGRDRFQLNSLNPLPVTHLLHEADERQVHMAGLDARFQMSSALALYTQLLLSEEYAEGIGFQLGLNWIRPGRSSFRIEYNDVPAYASGVSSATPDTEHYNQYITHLAGADFRELLAMAFIRRNRFFLRLKANYIDYKKKVTPGLPAGANLAFYPQTDVQVQEGALGWIINPANGMNVSIGILNRNNYINLLNNTSYLYFALRTNLPSAYYDF